MNSNFRFSNPQVIKFNFELNDAFVPKENQILNVEKEFHLQVSEIEKDNEMNKVVIVLEIKIGNEKPDSPFRIEVAEAALFKWKDGIYDQKKLNRLLNHNAPALLLSYIRPMITNVTANSKFPAYQLPFVDFTKVFPVEEETALEEKE